MVNESQDRSPLIDRAIRWLERHPRTVLTGTLAITVLAAAILNMPPEIQKDSPHSEDSEAPLFV